MTDLDPDALDFTTGSDRVTSVCAPCRQGRHLDCRGVDRDVDPADIYPFFDGDGPAPQMGLFDCGCLADATARRDWEKHAGVMEP